MKANKEISVEFFSNFWNFFIIYKFNIKFVHYYICNFFPNFHIFIEKCFIFYHKIDEFSLKKISFIDAISGKNIQKGLIFFITFVTNEIFKSRLPKGNLLDATILLLN